MGSWLLSESRSRLEIAPLLEIAWRRAVLSTLCLRKILAIPKQSWTAFEAGVLTQDSSRSEGPVLGTVETSYLDKLFHRMGPFFGRICFRIQLLRLTTV